MDKNIKRPLLAQEMCAALQMLEAGRATPDQQKKILPYIVNTICMYHDDPFVKDSRETTDYYLGRRSAACIIMDHVNIDLGSFRKKGEENDRE